MTGPFSLKNPQARSSSKTPSLPTCLPITRPESSPIPGTMTPQWGRAYMRLQQLDLDRSSEARHQMPQMWHVVGDSNCWYGQGQRVWTTRPQASSKSAMVGHSTGLGKFRPLKQTKMQQEATELLSNRSVLPEDTQGTRHRPQQARRTRVDRHPGNPHGCTATTGPTDRNHGTRTIYSPGDCHQAQRPSDGPGVESPVHPQESAPRQNRWSQSSISSHRIT